MTENNIRTTTITPTIKTTQKPFTRTISRSPSQQFSSQKFNQAQQTTYNQAILKPSKQIQYNNKNSEYFKENTTPRNPSISPVTRNPYSIFSNFKEFFSQ